jgi:vacuolar-type H+-ATPase subunit H
MRDVGAGAHYPLSSSRPDERGDAVVDDKVLEEIKFHQDVVEHDSASPLHRIREKEMEISGRVLKAKQQADEIIADARRKAADIIAKAQGEGDALARETEAAAVAEAEKEAVAIREKAAAEAAAMKDALASRRALAVDAIVKAVTQV